MRAGLAQAPAIGTIQAVRPDATIVDEPLGLRSHRFTIRGTVDIDDARELERRLRDVVLGSLLIACESAAIRHQLADLNDLFEFVDERPQRR
jgi:hypothetical protein